MSTYYATFETLPDGRRTVEALLRDGIPPENISLVGEVQATYEEQATMAEEGILGDASYYVGRADDPQRSAEAERRRIVGRVPLLEGDGIGGIDTSNRDLDVDSVDQAENSQEIAEESLYPFRGVSYASREASAVDTEMETNFPTRPAGSMDDVYDTETPLEDQNVDGLEVISVPGRGSVLGSGALATAALNLLDVSNPEPSQDLYRYLIEDGVPRPDAESYRLAVRSGRALIAVEIVPGRTHEDRVEQIIEQHHGEQPALFGGRRFHDTGGTIHEDVGGRS